MALGTAGTVLRHLHGLALAQRTRELSDGQLLRRFATQQEEGAFAAVVQRHGRLVWSVCRHVLGHEQDAEDAFQATFLVLARKAGAIHKAEALASWLHGTAYRVALRARRDAAIRRAHERQREPMPAQRSLPDHVLREALALLDEEVERLPQRQRAVFVLCCLEGKTLAEAARLLDWKEGTVSGTLARARQELRRRLTRRGITLSAVLAAVALGRHTAAAAVPAGLTRSTVAVVLASGIGKLVASRAAALADAVVPSLVAGRLRATTALVLVACLATAGVVGPRLVALGPPPAAPAQPAAEHPGRRVEDARRTVDARGDPLPPGAIARLGTMRFRHGGRIYCLAMSPDGRTLASRGLDGTIRLWDFATGRQRLMLRLVAPGRWNDTVAFSPDGKLLVTAEDRGGTAGASVGIFEAATGKKVLRWKVRGTTVTGVAFSPDGRTVAGITDRTVRLWDATTGRELRELRGHADEIEVMAFAPDGKLLATGSRDRTVRLWDPTTGRPVRRLEGKLALAPDVDQGVRGLPGLTLKQRGVLAVAFSPDGKRIAAVGSAEPTFRFWDVATGKELPRFPGASLEVTALLFLPDGQSIVTGSWDGTARVWDVDRRTETRRFRAQEGPILSLALTLEGRTLAAGGQRTIRLWDLAAGREIEPLPGHANDVYRVAFGPDGRAVATGSAGREHAVRLWDAGSGKETHLLASPAGEVDLLQFSPDGKTLVGGFRWNSRLSFWWTATGQVRGDTGLGHSGRFLPPIEHDQVAGTDNRGNFYLWNALTGGELAHTGSPKWNGGAISPDGSLLAVDSADQSGTLRILDVRTGREICRCPGYSRSLSAGPIFSPDGRYLAAAFHTDRRTVVVWDAATGERVSRCVGPETTYMALAFAPDGRSLASGGWDSTVYLWEVATGRERASYRGHAGAVLSLAFSPRGDRLVSGSQDTTALVWDVRRPEVPQPGDPSALWDDLAADDAVRAYRAIRCLAGDPTRTVAFLRERVKPARGPGAERLSRLLADLDSNRFETRQAAAQELEALGEIAAPALRRLNRDGVSLEVRRRAERILARLAPGASPERVRHVRAVEVLEAIATPEARHLLETLAGGVPEVLLTREARASLARLTSKDHPR